MLDYEKLYKEDPEAFFSWFYEVYRRFVYKEAWKYFNNAFDVDDLVQEVWLRLCNKGDQLCTYPKTQQCAYVAVVIRNSAISLARKQNENLPLEFAENLAYDEAAILNDIFDRKMKIEEFRKAWPLVPEHDRELLERKYFLLESDAEIASVMGIGKNSVRMALSRARKTAFLVLQGKKNKLL